MGGAIPLIYFVSFVPVIVLLASGKARQWFTYKKGVLTTKVQGKVEELLIDDLRVKSSSEFQFFKDPEIELCSMTTRVVTKRLGSSHSLSPEAAILVAELQKRGGVIDVLGYGNYSGRLESGKVPAEVRFPFVEIYRIVCGFFLFLFYAMVQSNDRLDPAVSDLLSLIIFISLLSWGAYAGLLGLRTINRKRGIYPLALNIEGESLVIEKHGKLAHELTFDEIKSVFVILTERPSDRDLISVTISTHYSRKIPLIDRALMVPIGISTFLEHARRKGVTVVYQKLRKGADVPDVIWEAKAEKAQDPVESTEAQFTGPSETQVRQTEG
jgi:hypothetical protein